jgi:hypothetical protein
MYTFGIEDQGVGVGEGERDVYVKSREIPEHRYWPDQNRPIRQNNPYWPSCSICIIMAVFIISSTII